MPVDAAVPALPAPLDADGLAALFAARPPRDAFGPDSDRPLLVVRRDAVARLPAAAPWLSALPCPVVGYGDAGATAPFDLIVATPARLAAIAARVAAAPIAAMVLVQHLRASHTLPAADALVAESMAYATLQAGAEFRGWLARLQQSEETAAPAAPLLMELEARSMRITLSRPDHRNAIDVAMRDALCEAFDLAATLGDALDDIALTAQGRAFSIGGDLGEFGLQRDPAAAHWIRSVRLPAAALLPVRDRLRVRVQGAAIGAGIELAAFAVHVAAAPDAWFQLPEIAYGLIPGAGGTVSVVRRVGRHRAAEMMLSGRRVRAVEALSWGLIDAIDG